MGVISIIGPKVSRWLSENQYDLKTTTAFGNIPPYHAEQLRVLVASWVQAEDPDHRFADVVNVTNEELKNVLWSVSSKKNDAENRRKRY